MAVPPGSKPDPTFSEKSADRRPDWADEAQRLHRTWPKDPNHAGLLTGGGEQLHYARFWRTGESATFECTQTYDVTDHRIFLPIKPWDLTFKVGSKAIFDTTLHPGQVSLTGPITNTRFSLYRGDYHVFCITVPIALLVEAAEENTGRTISPGIELFDAHSADDDVMLHIAMALFLATLGDVLPEPIYLDSLGLALAAHMISRYRGGDLTAADSRQYGLAGWRLERVTEYIEQHLNDELRLATLSSIAGLSRMHFAAQFKAATGLSPHSYVMERRIAAARSLLLNTDRSIQEIAAATGFRSDVHFVRRFRRAVGAPPGRWRNSILDVQKLAPNPRKPESE